MIQSPFISEERRVYCRRAMARLALFVAFAPFWLWGTFALYYGSWPHSVCVALALLYIWPAIGLWLPHVLYK